jgi:hypothetical protein
VFAAMLESDLAEAQSGTLIITDMSSKAMKEFLRYIYTGSLQTTPDTTMELDLVAELLNASEKVRLKSYIASHSIFSIVFNNSQQNYTLNNSSYLQYQLPHLKQFFNNTLVNLCTPQNSALLYNLADQYKLEKAMKDIGDFTKR